MMRLTQIIFVFSFIFGAMGTIITLAPNPTAALTVEEILDDPTLEKRARNLSKKLRCLVCQNQSIDDSDSDLAGDLRREVRTQLLAGKSDDGILTFLRTKYGDYVLLAPPLASQTIALWLAPIGFIVVGIALTMSIRRQRAGILPSNTLSAVDKARIKALTQLNKTQKSVTHDD